jgi:acetyltransferase-like isoleucine patch superfamily enzyme
MKKEDFFKSSLRAKTAFLYFHVKYHLAARLFYTWIYMVKAFLNDVHIGQVPYIIGRVHFFLRPGSRVSIGHRFTCVCNKKLSGYNDTGLLRIKTFSSKARITIGDDVDLNGTSLLCRSTSIQIGSQTMIAPNCIIADADFHTILPARRQDPGIESDKPVFIGKNVWIGMNCLILKGVTIGDNSVIGAGSVVTKDVEPNSIYAGNPARLIRKVNQDA